MTRILEIEHFRDDRLEFGHAYCLTHAFEFTTISTEDTAEDGAGYISGLPGVAHNKEGE